MVRFFNNQKDFGRKGLQEESDFAFLNGLMAALPVKKILINLRARIASFLQRYERMTARDRELEALSAKRAAEFLLNEEIWKLSEREPALLTDCGLYFNTPNAETMLYKDTVYAVQGRTYSEQQKKLLVMDCADKERVFFEKLHAKHLSQEAQAAAKPRQKIPEAVRIAVWRRDRGRCVECGGVENLQYDHLIPVDKGGSSTVENVQILCAVCNSKKGNRIDELPFSA